jgi:tRNA-dihydrouridine synthase
MMKDPKRAQEVILAAMEGSKGLPVSVKTRIGYNAVELETWLPAILETKPAAVTIHARTRKEMSDVPANWLYVKRAVEIAKGSGTVIIGNGDVRDLKDATMKTIETGADGAMLGRAVFGNPWLFNKTTQISDVPLATRLEVMIEHTRLFEEMFRDLKNFSIMKKHYKAYVNGFDGAKELRITLMEAESADEVESLVRAFLSR